MLYYKKYNNTLYLLVECVEVANKMYILTSFKQGDTAVNRITSFTDHLKNLLETFPCHKQEESGIEGISFKSLIWQTKPNSSNNYFWN